MPHVGRCVLKILTPKGRGRTIPTSGSRNYRINSAVKLIAYPIRPYRFSHWIIDNVLTVTSNIYVITMSVNHTVKAVFVKGYSVDVTIDPAGAGTVSKTPDKPLYEAGEVVTLTATPSPGYIEKGWTENGVVKPVGPLVITI